MQKARGAQENLWPKFILKNAPLRATSSASSSASAMPSPNVVKLKKAGEDSPVVIAGCLESFTFDLWTPIAGPVNSWSEVAEKGGRARLSVVPKASQRQRSARLKAVPSRLVARHQWSNPDKNPSVIQRARLSRLRLYNSSFRL